MNRRGSRTVDSREPEREIQRPLVAAGWSTQALPVGDFSFPEAGAELVRVERKTISQLLVDMSSGQASKQFNLLIAATPWPVLLVEGQWLQVKGKLLDSAYTWQQVWNFLQTWQDRGLRLQLSTSPQHSVQRVQDLADYYEKEVHESAHRHLAGHPWKDVLCRIKGVGPAKAQALLDHFGSLERIVAATPEDIAELKGFSPHLAWGVWDWWRSPNVSQR